MARRTDTRERMIAAGRRLYRARGYLGTAFSDVLADSGAPRGSVYFHFPGGKDEFAAEVVSAHCMATVSWLERMASESGSPRELVMRFLEIARDRAVATGYQEGCPVAAVVLEAAHASAELLTSAAAAMEGSVAGLAELLVAKGATSEDARRWATTAVTGYEGALVVSRAMRTPEPFDTLISTLRLAMDATTRPGPPPPGRPRPADS